jgi:hypothetical protein
LGGFCDLRKEGVARMVPTMPGSRWAAGFLTWLGMVLSVSAQSEEAEGTQQVVPAPILAPAPSVGPPPAQPAPISQAVKAPERWPLMQALQGTWLGAGLEDEQVQVLGWTQASFTASTDRDDQLPYGFNYKANRFLLQQNWLRLDRPVVTSGTSDPSFGFRSDWILPGSDYRFTLPRGIFNGQLTANHGQPNTYGIDPIQFYGEAYFPTIARGMDIKVGRFFSLYGVESTDGISNALISHSYTDIYDPFTHAGILTTTKLNDAWTAQAGIVLGSDDFIDPVDNATFIGSLRWVRTDQRDSVLANVIAGQGRFNQKRNFHNPEVFDLVYTHKFDPRLNYAFESLYGFTNNVPNIGTANWMGILNYLTYNITEQVSATTRLEFFDDFQGQRTGFAGLYTALGGVVAYRPVKWLQLRQELRYDYHTQTAPFEGKHGLFTVTSDFILRW